MKAGINPRPARRRMMMTSHHQFDVSHFVDAAVVAGDVVVAPVVAVVVTNDAVGVPVVVIRALSVTTGVVVVVVAAGSMTTTVAITGAAVVVVAGVSAGEGMVMDREIETEFPELSVTETVKLKVPAAFGVPEMVPVAASSDRPAGKAPETTDQL